MWLRSFVLVSPSNAQTLHNFFIPCFGWKIKNFMSPRINFDTQWSISHYRLPRFAFFTWIYFGDSCLDAYSKIIILNYFLIDAFLMTVNKIIFRHYGLLDWCGFIQNKEKLFYHKNKKSKRRRPIAHSIIQILWMKRIFQKTKKVYKKNFTFTNRQRSSRLICWT